MNPGCVLSGLWAWAAPNAYELAMALLYGLAMVVETLSGFGGTVLSLTLGAWLLPLGLLVPTLVLLNLPMNVNLLLREYRHVQLRLLLLTLAPWLLLGMAIGLRLGPYLDAERLRLLLGLAVAGMGALQLYRLARGVETPPLPRAVGISFYLAAGLLYALLGMCGPLVVFVLLRRLPQRRSLRATLNALWLLLNLAFLATHARELQQAHLRLALILLPTLPLAYYIGDRLHHRVSEAQFRWGVFGLMTLSGLVLALAS